MIGAGLLIGAALAQDVPPSLDLQLSSEEFSPVELVLSTAFVGFAVQTEPTHPRIGAVGLRGSVGPALDLSLNEDDSTDAFLATSVTLYARFGRGRMEVEGGAGPALLIGNGIRPAMMSDVAWGIKVTPRLVLRVGGVGYVGLYGGPDNPDPLNGLGQQLAFAPELGVGLRL